MPDGGGVVLERHQCRRNRVGGGKVDILLVAGFRMGNGRGSNSKYEGCGKGDRRIGEVEISLQGGLKKNRPRKGPQVRLMHIPNGLSDVLL